GRNHVNAIQPHTSISIKVAPKSTRRKARPGARRPERKKAPANSGEARILSAASADQELWAAPLAPTYSIRATSAVMATAGTTTQSTSQNERGGLREERVAAVGGGAAAPKDARKRRLSQKSYMAAYVCLSGPLVEAT